MKCCIHIDHDNNMYLNKVSLNIGQLRYIPNFYNKAPYNYVFSPHPKLLNDARRFSMPHSTDLLIN